MKPDTHRAPRSSALSSPAHSPLRRRASGAAVTASWVTASLLTACLAASCSSGGGGGQSGGGELVPTGDGTYALTDPNFGGDAAQLLITSVKWGRLVDVFDETGDPLQPTTLVFRDFLIDHAITGGSFDYSFEANPVSGKERITIHHPKESAEFRLVAETLQDAQPVLSKGIDPTELPPFTAVARNGAVSIQLNDAIDGSTLTAETVLLRVGNPPSVPYESRIIADPSHGAIVKGQFHSTRILIDFTITTLDSQQNPNLQVNTLGLPGAQVIDQANVAVHLPTLPGSGQFKVLTNLSGHPLSFTSNGPTVPTSSTLDVVRAFRSQGKTGVTGDLNNGFLPDEIAPSVLTSQGVFVNQPNKPADPALVDITFQSPACAMNTRAGDILEFAGFIFQIVSPGTLNGAQVSGARVIALVGDLESFGPSFGLFKTTWDPSLGALPECFVRFNPLPATEPNLEVVPQGTVLLSFSEPIDPSTVQALDTFVVSYETPPLVQSPLYENVIGQVLPAPDLQTFTFAPSLPLRHIAGTSETYFIDVVGDDPNTGTPTIPVIEGITDLAGNGLAFALPQTSFTILAAAPTQETAGVGLRFVDPLFDEDGDGFPDLRGQIVHNVKQAIRPRNFSRFSVAADGNQPIIGAMITTQAPIQTPLSSLGSKMMTIWRYIDLGFSLLDDQTHNLDVEGLYWSPYASGVQQDFFPNFRVALAHCFYLPDEVTNSGLLPNWKNSGLVPNFTTNLLDPFGDPLAVMAPKDKGYLIKPEDVGVATTGTLIVPWPVNREIQLSDFLYWTWRDTAKLQVAAPNGAGADPQRLNQVLQGIGLLGFYNPNQVPTIGLPLLMEFRCYPDDQAFGLNGFKTSFALNSSYKPTFRAYSTGGQGPTGTVVVDPDNEATAKGGINPTTGAQTLPIDNTFYWGQADFVVRISRAHTRWFDTTTTHDFAQPVLEPSPIDQPTGTQTILDYRGASDLSSGAGTPWVDTGNYDPYGNGYNSQQLNFLQKPTTDTFTVVFHPAPNDSSWSSDPSIIDGARFFQIRVTFVSNAVSGLTPELAALGIAFTK